MNVDMDLSEIDFSKLDLKDYMLSGNPNDVKIRDIRRKYFPKTFELISEKNYLLVPELGIQESSDSLLVAPFVNKCSIIGSKCSKNGIDYYTISHIPPTISHEYYMDILRKKGCDRENYFSIGQISNDGWKYAREKKISMTQIKCNNDRSKDIILSPLENMLWIVSEDQIFEWNFK